MDNYTKLVMDNLERLYSNLPGDLEARAAQSHSEKRVAAVAVN